MSTNLSLFVVTGNSELLNSSPVQTVNTSTNDFYEPENSQNKPFLLFHLIGCFLSWLFPYKPKQEYFINIDSLGKLIKLKNEGKISVSEYKNLVNELY